MAKLHAPLPPTLADALAKGISARKHMTNQPYFDGATASSALGAVVDGLSRSRVGRPYAVPVDGTDYEERDPITRTPISPRDLLKRYFPSIYTQHTDCPLCGNRMDVASLLLHMGKDHDYTREHIEQLIRRYANMPTRIPLEEMEMPSPIMPQPSQPMPRKRKW